MKDILIKASSIRRELLVYLTVFIVAFFSNVYAIIAYSGRWAELYTQLHIVFLLSIFLYLLLALIRLVIYGVRTAIKGRKTVPE